MLEAVAENRPTAAVGGLECPQEALVNKMRGDRTDPLPGSELDRLTPREREVFQLIALGKHNKQIAQTLHLSLGTVKKHRENLQRKLDVHSAAEIAASPFAKAC